MNLMLHCGSSLVNTTELRNAATPHGTSTHTPIPHHTLLYGVRKALQYEGFGIASEAHGMTNDGARYFGMLELMEPEDRPSDHGWVLGLRNSHDKRFASGVVLGSSVMVCDNLAFSGEIQMSRKHTSRILDELPGLLTNTIGKLRAGFEEQTRRYGYYKQYSLTSSEANQLLIMALDEGIISGSQIPKVLKEYRMPSHSEFRSGTVWSLFNAFTEVLKGTALEGRSVRTQRLHRLCDNFTYCN